MVPASMKLGGIASSAVAPFVGLIGLCAMVACSSNANGGGAGDGGVTCGTTTVEDMSLQACSSCTPASACTAAAPLDACCNWLSAPTDPLLLATGLHRYSAPNGATLQNTPTWNACLSVEPDGGTTSSMTATLTGYVWLFSSGQDSQGVQVDVFAENNPNTDGTIPMNGSLGTYTTSMSDPIDPTDSTWNSKCDNGCSYRQYVIKDVPLDTPLVIRTMDAGSMQWATLYDYAIYFPSSSVTQGPGGTAMVTYDATAVAGPDLPTVAGAVGLSIQPNEGLLAGEVHDCDDVRLGGATVGTDAPNGSPVYYFTSDESEPLPSQDQRDTSVLGLYGLINVPTGVPIRVSALGADPNNAGQYLMLGTYTVQVYSGAVTALVLRGRRPWQL